MAQSNSPARAWEVSTRWCVLGVAPRDRLVESGSLAMCGSWGGSAGQVLHSQGSLGRWGYRADALWGICCYDPVLVPALSRCCTIFLGALGKELLLKGNGMGLFGDRLLGIGNRGGVCLLGVGPRDRSCTRRDRSGGGAIALTRFRGFVATIQCSFRPCPAAAPFFWGHWAKSFC
jgi:hypothetical protein